jgi:circadian clock protein KaiC
MRTEMPSGIRGLDETTVSGFPCRRVRLNCGDAGAVKTLFAPTDFVEGALDYGEPGVICIEETDEDLWLRPAAEPHLKTRPKIASPRWSRT